MKKLLCIAVVAVVIAGAIFAYVTQREVVFTSGELGFRMTVPNRWGRQLALIPDETNPQTTAVFTSPDNKIGHLAYVQKYTLADWAGVTVGTTYQELGKNEQHIFILTYPGDVQWDINDKQSEKAYQELGQQFLDGNYTFEIV